MSLKKLILFLLLLIPFTGFCSCGLTVGRDTLNQRDSTGKKNGYWVLYLNRSLHNKKDSNRACYYRYTYYDHGVNLYPMGGVDKKWTLTHTPSNNKHMGTITELDGTFTWKDNKGITRAVITYKNGLCCIFRWFYPSGEEYYTWDYTRPFRKQAHTYTYYFYDKHRNIKYYYFRKINGQWLLIRGSKDEI